jgi:hypothetical protein
MKVNSRDKAEGNLLEKTTTKKLNSQALISIRKFCNTSKRENKQRNGILKFNSVTVSVLLCLYFQLSVFQKTHSHRKAKRDKL